MSKASFKEVLRNMISDLPTFKKHNFEDSRYYKKIQYLKDNWYFAINSFQGDKIPEWNPAYSNCWGTMAYILGIDKKIKDMWESSQEFKDLDSLAFGDYVNLPPHNRPGYVGRKPLEFFIENSDEVERTGPEKDSMVLFSWKADTPYLLGHGLRHSGIHLKDGWFFHQTNIGIYNNSNFEFRKMSRFKFGLTDEARETLEIKFYRLRD